MKYYIDKKGDVHSSYRLQKLLYLMTGNEYGHDKLEKKIFKNLPMIEREVAPEEWRLVAKISKVAAVQLYREMAGVTSIKEAIDAVDAYLKKEGGRIDAVHN